MMENIDCGLPKETGRIKTEVEVEPDSYEEVETIKPEECPTVKLEPELEDDFCTVTDIIKCEGSEGAGEFQTVYLKQPKLLETNRVQNSESQSTGDNFSPSLCRLCATRSKNMIHFLNPDQLYRNIIEKIDQCLPIRVRETDRLPKEACLKCLEKLELCYQFHNSVAEAERKLVMSSEEMRGILNEKTGVYEIEYAKNNERLRVSSFAVIDDNKSEANFEDLPLIDRIVENSGVASNSKFISEQLRPVEIHRFNNSDVAKPDNWDNDNIVSCKNVSESQTSAGRMIPAKIFKCEICGEAFPFTNRLRCHLNTHASLKKYPCGFCNENLTTKRDWIKHCQEHTEDQNSRKVSDKQENKFITQLKRKFNKLCHKSSPTKLQCIPADQQIKTPEHTNPDVKKNGRAVECAECKLILNSDYLQVHKESYCTQSVDSQTEIKPILTQIEDLNRLKSKTNRAVKCDTCWKRFHVDIIKVHKETCHAKLPTKKYIYSCAYCAKEFDRKSHFIAHIRSHTGEKPHTCDLCPKSFSSRRASEAHLKLHKGRQLFACSICNKTFARLAALRGHSRVHNPQSRNSECPICHENFQTTSMRNFHMAIHPGEKPCQCDHCGIYFRKKGSLAIHMRAQHGPVGDET